MSDEQEDELSQQEATVSEAEYQKVAQALADQKDKYLRLLAEFENARKRSDRERAEYIKYASEDILAQFLNVLDDLERSVHTAKANHQDYASFLKGMELVMGNVQDMLKKNNVKPILSVGKKFDPHLHEPLMQVEDDSVEEGIILEEFQKGFFLGDRVLRTAKVKVAVKKSANHEQSTQTKEENKN